MSPNLWEGILSGQLLFSPYSRLLLRLSRRLRPVEAFSKEAWKLAGLPKPEEPIICLLEAWQSQDTKTGPIENIVKCSCRRDLKAILSTLFTEVY